MTPSLLILFIFLVGTGAAFVAPACISASPSMMQIYRLSSTLWTNDRMGRR
jgi:hypothetical protein